MASIKAAGDQTRLFTRAQSAEEKKRLQLAAQKSALPLAAALAAGTAGNAPVSPAGTGGAANQARNAYAQLQARQERDRIMTSGDNRAITQYLRQESMQRTADRLAAAGNTAGTAGQPTLQNLYQAAVASSTPAAQPVRMKDHLVFGNPSAGFQSGMSARDRASWDAIGRKYAAGDVGWNRDTNQFRKDGNWGSYYDDNGKINGWLYAGDGMGGYAPVFGGKVGETGYKPGTVFYSPDGKAYTMGADGTLTLSGTVEWARYGEYVGPKAGYQNSSFWALDDSGNYKKYYNATAPEKVLEAAGYYRNANGLVLPIDDQYRLAQAVKNGAITPEQAAKIKAQQSGYIPGGSVSTAAGTIPGASEEYAARITPTQKPAPGATPAVDPGSYRQAEPENMQADSRNIYQRYLDRWDYPAPPEWDGTEYERKRDELLESAMDPYEGSPYDERRDDALAAYGEAWQGSEYQKQRDEALRRAENMRWNYDPSADPVWQAMQKQYRREGDRATQDALGRYAAMTGGVPSSYAVTAASQAGDYYAAQLSERLPQLYQDAYDRYLREYERQMGISDQYQGFDDREYSRWADRQGKNLDLADRYDQYGRQDYDRYMDRVSRQLSGADRYDQYGGREYERYMDRLGQYYADRSFDYGRYRDAVGDYRYDDETRYGRDYQARRDAVSDERAERAWAQELREYADAQGWKTAEWQQYLREYGDQLSERERQWAYEMAQDAEDRRLDAEETAWQRELRLAQLAYDRERDAEADRRWETQYQQSLREYDDAQKQREFENAMTTLRASGEVEDRSAGSVGSGQRAAGKTKTAASGKDAAEYSGMVYAGTHPDGRRRTVGYGELKTMLRNALMGGSRDEEQMRRMIDDWAAQGRIEDYEISILRQEFGLETTARGGASGGRALQYTK